MTLAVTARPVKIGMKGPPAAWHYRGMTQMRGAFTGGPQTGGTEDGRHRDGPHQDRRAPGQSACGTERTGERRAQGGPAAPGQGTRPDGAGGALDRAEHLEESVTGELDLEDRQALRRVAGLAGLSTELRDVTEVEYRELRLERVVLIGVADRAGRTAAWPLRSTHCMSFRSSRRRPGRRFSRASSSGAAGPTRQHTSARARPRNWPRSSRRRAPTR